MRRGLSVPAEPRTFTQTLDHFAAPTLNGTTFPQRYYLNDTAFGGPGHPLLVIMGGEGAIPPSTGFFYPWVVDVLAPRFKALVLEPEHRFYGTSVPPDAYDTATLHHLTPQQALADTVALIRSVQSSKGCSARGTAEYCPVITIGGSYPGWLSAMMRLRYPAVVDGAYAASAPMRFYAQQVDQFSYYQVITRSAEAAAAGCAKAVRAATHLLPTADTPTLVAKLNLCTPLPPYIVRGGDATAQTELLMILAVSFAGLNMGNYPPGPATGLTQACEGFLGANTTDAQWQSLRAFLGGGGGSLRHARFRAGRALVAGARSNETHHSLAGQDAEAPSRRKTRGGGAAACFNVSAALPATARHGSAGTFSCGDWSGCGTGDNGLSCAAALPAHCLHVTPHACAAPLFPAPFEQCTRLPCFHGACVCVAAA